MTSGSTTILLHVGRIGRTDIPALCAHAREVLQGCAGNPVVFDVGALTAPDAVTVDALARLQLTARRVGRRLELRHACGELYELLDLMGLIDVLPCVWESGVEMRRQAEEREKGRCVQEEGDPHDPSV